MPSTVRRSPRKSTPRWLGQEDLLFALRGRTLLFNTRFVDRGMLSVLTLQGCVCWQDDLVDEVFAEVGDVQGGVFVEHRVVPRTTTTSSTPSISSSSSSSSSSHSKQSSRFVRALQQDMPASCVSSARRQQGSVSVLDARRCAAIAARWDFVDYKTLLSACSSAKQSGRRAGRSLKGQRRGKSEGGTRTLTRSTHTGLMSTSTPLVKPCCVQVQIQDASGVCAPLSAQYASLSCSSSSSSGKRHKDLPAFPSLHIQVPGTGTGTGATQGQHRHKSPMEQGTRPFGSPFLPHTYARVRDRKINYTPGPPKVALPNGYCEGCDQHFMLGPEQHIKSDVHQAYVNNATNFVELDAVISSVNAHLKRKRDMRGSSKACGVEPGEQPKKRPKRDGDVPQTEKRAKSQLKRKSLRFVRSKHR